MSVVRVAAVVHVAAMAILADLWVTACLLLQIALDLFLVLAEAHLQIVAILRQAAMAQETALLLAAM